MDIFYILSFIFIFYQVKLGSNNLRTAQIFLRTFNMYNYSSFHLLLLDGFLPDLFSLNGGLCAKHLIIIF